MSDDSSILLLAIGPAGAIGFYWAIHRYYRNTHQSHGFERETAIQPGEIHSVDEKSGRITGTRRSGIEGANGRQFRLRVQRERAPAPPPPLPPKPPQS